MLIWILILGLVLRLFSLNQSLWLDEAILAQAVSQLSFSELFQIYLPTDFNPPLIYAIEWFWGRLFGFSEIALRLPSVIFGLLAIYYSYLLGEQLLKKFSWLPALLLATSGLHIYYSQEARMYSLTVFLITGSMWSLLQFIKNDKRKLPYLLFTVAALYSHYLAWFILPAQLAIVYLIKPKKIWKWGQLAVLILLTLIPWMPIFWQQLAAGSSASVTTWGQVVGSLSFKQIALVPIKFLIGRISFASDFIYGLVLAPIFLIASKLFFNASQRLSSKQAKSDLLVWLWLIVPLVSIIILSFKLPLLAYFRLLYLLPAVYLLFGLGLEAGASKWQKPVVIFLVGFNLFVSVYYLTNPLFHRENWRQLSQILTSMREEPEPVFMASPVQSPLKYYFAGSVNSFEQRDNLTKVDDLWVVPYAQAIFDPQNDFQNFLTANGFQQAFVKHFGGDISLVKYKRL